MALIITRKRSQRGSLYRRGRSPNWYGKYRDAETGKVKRVSLKTESKREARRKLDNLIAPPKPTVSPVPPVGTFMSVANEWLKWYQSKAITEGRKVKAQKILDGRFKAAFGQTPIQRIGDTAINEYLNGRLETAAFGTVRIEKQYLSQIFKRAMRKGLIRFNPVDDYQWPKGASKKAAKETLTMPQLKEILTHVESDTDRNVLTLFALTGARKQELVDAVYSDIDTNGDGLLKITLNSGKTKTSRKIPLAPQAIACIEALREDGRDTVLPEAKANRWYNVLKTAASKAGFDSDNYRVNIHGLRHAFCSHWANRPDCPVIQVMEWAGHSKIETTCSYLRRDETQSNRLMASMEF